MKEKVLISACLIGENCRYDGKNCLVKDILKLTKYYDLIPFCPELLGGLKAPRKPCEIKDGNVITPDNKDLTEKFKDGAYWATSVAKVKNIKLAILKEKSPSCGVHKIYDGTFSSKLIDGSGITAKALKDINIKVINENEAIELLKKIENNE